MDLILCGCPIWSWPSSRPAAHSCPPCGWPTHLPSPHPCTAEALKAETTPRRRLTRKAPATPAKPEKKRPAPKPKGEQRRRLCMRCAHQPPPSPPATTPALTRLPLRRLPSVPQRRAAGAPAAQPSEALGGVRAGVRADQPVRKPAAFALKTQPQRTAHALQPCSPVPQPNSTAFLSPLRPT